MFRKLAATALLFAAWTPAHAQVVVGTINLGNPLLQVQITDNLDSNLTDHIGIQITNSDVVNYVCSGRIGFFSLTTGAENPSAAIEGQVTVAPGGPYLIVGATNPANNGLGNSTAYDSATCSPADGGNNGGTGSMGSGALSIQGQFSYSADAQAKSVQIQVGEILNSSPSITTGSLLIELWALASPATTGGVSGYMMAAAPMPTQCGVGATLGPGASCLNISLTTAFAAPPPGTYYVALVIAEHDSVNCTSPGNYCVAAFGNFTSTMTISPTGLGGSSGGVEIVGGSTESVNVTGNSAQVSVNEIVNSSPARQTGSLRMELWATSSPYTRGVPGTGYRLVAEPLPAACSSTAQLNPLASCGNITFSRALASVPPVGTYYVSLLVTEYDPANCTTSDHYCTDTGINYNGTLTVTAAPPPPPPAPASSGGGGGAMDWFTLAVFSAALFMALLKRRTRGS